MKRTQEVKQLKSYREQAKWQNMSVARTKAIAILELIAEHLTGQEWFDAEDKVAEIINSK